MNQSSQGRYGTDDEPRTVAARSLGQLLNDTFAIYGANFRRLIVLVAVVQVPLALFGLVPLHGLVGFFVVGVASLIGGVCVYGAIICAVGQHHVTGEVSIESCYRRVWWRVLSLCVLAVGLASLALLSEYLASSAVTGKSAVAGALLAVVGIALFLVLAVYLMVTPQAVIVEGLRPLDALKRSFLLVQDSWSRVFGIGLVLLLVLMGLALVLAIPFGMASALAAPEGASTVGDVFLFLAGVTVSIAVPPVASIATTLLYFDLRVRKEKYDTEALSRELGVVTA